MCIRDRADTVIPKLPAVTEPEDTEQGNDNAAKDEKLSLIHISV